MLCSLNTSFDYSTVLKYLTNNVIWGMQLVYMIEYAIANRWIIPAAETIGIKCTPCQGNIINDMFE